MKSIFLSTKAEDQSWNKEFHETQPFSSVTKHEVSLETQEKLQNMVLRYMADEIFIRDRDAFTNNPDFKVKSSCELVTVCKFEQMRIVPFIRKMAKYSTGKLGKDIKFFDIGDTHIVLLGSPKKMKKHAEDFINTWTKENLNDALGFLVNVSPATDGEEFIVACIGYEENCGICKGKKIIDCTVCHGEGKHKCFSCNGNGVCSKCHGRGIVPCPECGGYRYLPGTCPQCHGSGRDYSPWNDNEFHECYRCKGKGIVYETPCDACYGDGAVDCSCRNGVCQTCNGQKIVPCLNCNSRGVETCKNCGGTGILHEGYIVGFKFEKRVKESLYPDQDLLRNNEEFSRIIDEIITESVNTSQDWRIVRCKVDEKTLSFSRELSTCYQLYKVDVKTERGNIFNHYLASTSDGRWYIASLQDYSDFAVEMLPDIQKICSQAGLFHGNIYDTLITVADETNHINKIEVLLNETVKGRKQRDKISWLIKASSIRAVLKALLPVAVFLVFVPLLASFVADALIPFFRQGTIRDFIESIIKAQSGRWWHDAYENVILSPAIWQTVLAWIFAYIAMIPGYAFLKRLLRKRAEKFEIIGYHNRCLFGPSGMFSYASDATSSYIRFFVGVGILWMILFWKDIQLYLL